MDLLRYILCLIAVQYVKFAVPFQDINFIVQLFFLYFLCFIAASFLVNKGVYVCVCVCVCVIARALTPLHKSLNPWRTFIFDDEGLLPAVIATVTESSLCERPFHPAVNLFINTIYTAYIRLLIVCTTGEALFVNSITLHINYTTVHRVERPQNVTRSSLKLSPHLPLLFNRSADIMNIHTRLARR